MRAAAPDNEQPIEPLHHPATIERLLEEFGEDRAAEWQRQLAAGQTPEIVFPVLLAVFQASDAKEPAGRARPPATSPEPDPRAESIVEPEPPAWEPATPSE